jgi:hypothetical protein
MLNVALFIVMLSVIVLKVVMLSVIGADNKILLYKIGQIFLVATKLRPVCSKKAHPYLKAPAVVVTKRYDFCPILLNNLSQT